MKGKTLTVAVAAMLLMAGTVQIALGTELAGGAIRITGDGQFVVVPNSSSLNPTTAITIEAWYMPQDYWSLGYEAVVEKPYTSHTVPHYQYTLGVTGNYYGAGSSEYDYRFNSAVAILPDYPSADVHTLPDFWTPGTWYHLAASYNGEEVSLYVNGTLLTSRAVSGSLASFDTPLTIGGHYNVSLNLRGDIDEVRVWNTARTPAEIATNYNQIVAPDSPGLVGYWNFDEPLGQYILDQTGYANDGTLGMTNVVGSDDPLRVLSTAPIIPEPATLSLLALGALAVLRKRRK